MSDSGRGRRDGPEDLPDDLPVGVDPLGVPRQHSGQETFIIVAAVALAVLVLIFTLGWIAFHRLTS